MKKRCGNCGNFGRVKSFSGSDGICEEIGWRCNVDSGKDCEDWVGIKYNRRKKHKESYDEC